MVSPVEQIPLLSQEVWERQARRDHGGLQVVWNLLDVVVDPEIPVLSLWELGVLQDVQWDDGMIVISITPTYSGCPAIEVMEQDIRQCLSQAGYNRLRVERCLTPVWGTHFMDEAAKEKLRQFQVAAPGALACPNCGSANVAQISEFSSTACKSLYRCGDCQEPFDYFKPI